jgi:hypothetical protein
MVGLEMKGLFMDGLELASRGMNAPVIAMAETRVDRKERVEGGCCSAQGCHAARSRAANDRNAWLEPAASAEAYL